MNSILFNNKISPFAKLMSEPRPSFFSRILKSGYPLDFFGPCHRANSHDHFPEIKFQRICLKFFEFFSDISFADGDKCLLIRPRTNLAGSLLGNFRNFKTRK